MDKYLTLLSFGPEGWGDEIARGVVITVSLALATLPFGLLWGLLLAMGQQSKEGTLRLAVGIYTTIFRGLPELLTLFLVYFGIPIVLNLIVVEGFGGEPIDVNNFFCRDDGAWRGVFSLCQRSVFFRF